jgi:hypothetical protein
MIVFCPVRNRALVPIAATVSACGTNGFGLAFPIISTFAET